MSTEPASSAFGTDTGRTEPCPTCPWRRSSPADGSKIPNFSIELMRSLANTVGNHDAFRPIMACHYSTFASDDYPCVGYVAQHGYSNIAVRLSAAQGRLELVAMIESCEEIDLWPDFWTMLAAYEAAVSGEVTVADPGVQSDRHQLPGSVAGEREAS